MQKKITAFKASLICINSMIGAGLFINTKPLTQLAGAYGFVAYIIAAFIMLPLIISIARLAARHPVAGGLYVYSKTYIGSWAGFLSGWFYFIGKTTSAAVLLHRFVLFLQPRINVLDQIPTLLIDFGTIFALVLLNSIGLSVGGRIQYMFTTLKAAPLLFSFGIGTLLFQPGNFYDVFNPSGIVSTVPIAMFPLLGFEVICAIANMVENASQNLGKIIMGSFFFVVTVTLAFHMSAFGVLGQSLSTINEPVLALGMKMFSSSVASLFNGCVFASIIGGCFSLLTSNCWNLHTIARHGHFPLQNFLTKLNRFNVPWVALICEALVGCFLLFVTLDQVPLQNMAVFAQIIAFLFSAAAAFVAVKQKSLQHFSAFFPVAAIVSGLVTISICLYRLNASGVSFPFLALLLTGVGAAWMWGEKDQ